MGDLDLGLSYEENLRRLTEEANTLNSQASGKLQEMYQPEPFSLSRTAGEGALAILPMLFGYMANGYKGAAAGGDIGLKGVTNFDARMELQDKERDQQRKLEYADLASQAKAKTGLANQMAMGGLREQALDKRLDSQLENQKALVDYKVEKGLIGGKSDMLKPNVSAKIAEAYGVDPSLEYSAAEARALEKATQEGRLTKNQTLKEDLSKIAFSKTMASGLRPLDEKDLAAKNPDVVEKIISVRDSYIPLDQSLETLQNVIQKATNQKVPTGNDYARIRTAMGRAMARLGQLPSTSPGKAVTQPEIEIMYNSVLPVMIANPGANYASVLKEYGIAGDPLTKIIDTRDIFKSEFETELAVRNWGPSEGKTVDDLYALGVSPSMAKLDENLKGGGENPLAKQIMEAINQANQGIKNGPAK